MKQFADFNHKYPRKMEQFSSTKEAVWKELFCGFTPDRSVQLSPNARVVTMGSCFAVNIANSLRKLGVAAESHRIHEEANSPQANAFLLDFLLNGTRSKYRSYFEDEISESSRQSFKASIAEANIFIMTLGVGISCFDRKSKRLILRPNSREALDSFWKLSAPDEIMRSISTAIKTLRRLRKDIPVVVTVSPVPIYRSFLTPSALVDDCMSKAALRSAVPAILERNGGVYYWPSFELFRWFGSHIEPAFGEDDLLPRHPNSRLVELAVDSFIRAFFVERAVDGCDVVFHLGALIGIPYSYEAPEAYVQTNVVGTLNVLKGCVRAGVRRLLNTSTSEVYGTALFTPIHEEHPLQGQSPYSASKIGADKLVESFHRSFGLDTVTVRPFNTFGPRQSARAVIPAIISQMLAGRKQIRLGSLTPRRDLNYVSNTVDAYLLAAGAEGIAGETIHFGSNREVSIGELFTIIRDLIGCEAEVESDPARLRPEKSEVGLLLADNSKALRLLGWQPKVGLEEGLARMIEWTRENSRQFRVDEYAV